MKLELRLFLLLAVANARMKFDYTILFDMNDFKGQNEYHIGDCVRGCQVYLTYAQDKDGMADKVNGPITILIDDDNKITFFDLMRSQQEDGQKGFFDIPEGTIDFTIKNPNADFDVRPLALWIVPYKTPFLKNIQIFEASNGAQITANEHRVVFMRVEPFTINADIVNPDYELYVYTSPIDMISTNECEYVFKFNNTIGPGFSLPVNSPIISFSINSGFDIALSATIDFDFPSHRSIDSSGYFSSPGYIGCSDKNEVFHSDSYASGDSCYKETFIVDGDTIQNVSFYGDLNTPKTVPILLYDGDTDDEPLIIFGTQLENTTMWSYDMLTSSFSLSWDDNASKGKNSFMIRYEVNGTTSSTRTTVANPKTSTTPKPTGTSSSIKITKTPAVESTVTSTSTITSTSVITPTTSSSGLKDTLFAVISLVAMLHLH
ncbi:hypothetical protein PRIPAC_95144 [Pristionchus pacificus]|uniref:Uncharacterized protein n=1 Tax=Pristionchus pacificus TaxID=54126 RepID=A0A2A6CUG2_PRIPA|nr:hypothetical protein PRIPAC_95144 [Pristionchus pacificus]|eukprot:PDM81683.1 hypothetical protein PRIPAC_30664 [Pristionchus pacificus]